MIARYDCKICACVRKGDKDLYYDDIVIKPVDQESMREIEFIILEQEVKDGVQKNRRGVDAGNS